jgi:glycerol-3-phosphate acyltransferase PlsX
VDPDEHGGAPLLGVRGVSIIAHGKSSPRAITNAILVAARAWSSGMTAELEARLAPAGEAAA